MISDKGDRLEAFEKMLLSVKQQYEAADEKMKQLKSEETGTYRPLMGNKMQLQYMLSMYQVYDLTEK